MRKILSLVRACVDGYGMIQAGDKVAVGVSGGKDSLSLLMALARLREFHPSGFGLVAITLDMGFENADFDGVARLCQQLGVPYIVKKTNIKEVIFDIRKEKNPCSMCAKLRRGSLNTAALEAGASKVALGHHWDDAVETFMLSLLYEGRISCFQPVTYLDRTGVTQVRPMLYVKESATKSLAARYSLPIVHNPCPADKCTKRQETKLLICELEQRYPNLRENIFGGLQRSPLPGWSKLQPPEE